MARASDRACGRPAGRPRPRPVRGATWLASGFALMLAVMLGASACGAMVRTFTGRRVTGTCAGACERYVECKAGSTTADQARCLAECPQVFSDAESIGAFESLECHDVVTYVDGNAVTRADRLEAEGAAAQDAPRD